MARINAFADRLANGRPAAAPVSRWRALVLIYPNTDTDYQTHDGQRLHYRGSLPGDQVASLYRTFSAMPELVRRLTGGYCEMAINIQVVPRPVTFGGRVGFLCPQWQTDCAPEKRILDDPRPHDVVIIVHNPGDVPQDLAGAGGGSDKQCVQNYRADVLGTKNDTVDRALSGIIHEWIHGLDAVFARRGYRGMDLHHLVRFKEPSRKFPGYGYNPNWHAGILQGRQRFPADASYGFSRAVWMSGSGQSQIRGVLPVQLGTPVAGALLPADGTLRFTWNPIPNAARYRLRVYSRDRYETPIISKDATETCAEVTLPEQQPGSLVWTVQAVDNAGKLSPVGEAFPLELRERAQLPPIQAAAVFNARQVIEVTANRNYPVRVSASSPCGVRAVYYEAEYKDGRRLRVPLCKQSPNENETVWTGNAVLWSPRGSEAAAVLEPNWVIVDGAERELTVPAAAVRVSRPNDREEGGPNLQLVDPVYTRNHIEEARLPHIPSVGGTYPIYLKFQIADSWGLEGAWLEITSENGSAPNRIGLQYWGEYKGFYYAQLPFPPNRGKHQVFWTLQGGGFRNGTSQQSPVVTLVQAPGQGD